MRFDLADALVAYVVADFAVGLLTLGCVLLLLRKP